MPCRLPRKLLKDSIPHLARQTTCQIAVLKQSDDCLAKLPCMTRLNQKTCPFRLDNFGYASYSSGNDGHLHRTSLEQNEAEGFIT